MGATHFNLKPADITHNLYILSNLQEKQKLCSDEQGRLSIDDRWVFVTFRRKFGALDIGAIEQTFQKAIEFLREEGSDEISLKNTISEIKERMNEAVMVGLVRQLRIYNKEEKKEAAKRLSKLILSTIEQYNKLNPHYPINLYRKVKEEIDDILLDENLKKALVPTPPPPPKKKKESNDRGLSDQEKKLQEALLKGRVSHAAVGYVMLDSLGRVNLRHVGMRILAERKQQSSSNRLFDETMIDRVREKEEEEWQTVKRKPRGKAPLEQPLDTKLVDSLNKRRERIV